MNGRILKGVGGLYSVELENGDVIEAKARGIFRNQEISPLAGDHVVLDGSEERHGIITQILPRKNHLLRPPISNLDQLIFVVSVCDPKPNPLILDKLIAVAEYKKIEPIIVITKVDISSGDALFKTYQEAGFRTYLISNEEPSSAAPIKKLLAGKLSAFTGNSGVGKSSLLNNIAPKLSVATGDISKKLGRGKHTTRTVELFPLEDGGYIADTPGFSSLETGRYEIILKDELQYCFREFQPYLDQCRFHGCSHVLDKGCAVLEAVKNGRISASRHSSYCIMYEEAKNIKEWEYNTKD